jgi:4-oxalocrotonate tautomerase
MPHVIVKLHAGRSETLKLRLADAVAKAVMSTLNMGEESVSVSIEDVKPEHWAERVYGPDVLGKSETLYKKPGYNPL